MLIPSEFFARPPEEVAVDLLGAVVVTKVDGEETGGTIVYFIPMWVIGAMTVVGSLPLVLSAD